MIETAEESFAALGQEFASGPAATPGSKEAQKEALRKKLLAQGVKLKD